MNDILLFLKIILPILALYFLFYGYMVFSLKRIKKVFDLKNKILEISNPLSGALPSVNKLIYLPYSLKKNYWINKFKMAEEYQFSESVRKNQKTIYFKYIYFCSKQISLLLSENDRKKNIVFKNCAFDASYFLGLGNGKGNIKFIDCCFYSHEFYKNDFSNCIFKNCMFVDCKFLAENNFNNAKFSGCSFGNIHSLINFTTIENAQLKNCRFRETDYGDCMRRLNYRGNYGSKV
jgi:hypothetical protein